MTEGHNCTSPQCDYDTYGSAIFYCYQDEDGRFWVSNGEYCNVVKFCPFCGIPAPNQEMVSKVWQERKDALQAEADKRHEDHLNSEAHKNHQCMCLTSPTTYLKVHMGEAADIFTKRNPILNMFGTRGTNEPEKQ